MVDVTLLVAVAAIISIFLLVFAFFKPNSSKVEVNNEREAVAVAARPAPVIREEGRPRARRNRLRPAAAVAANRVNDEDDDGVEDDEEDPLAREIALPDGKIGAKKRKKLEMKAEKRAQREQDETEREERKQRQTLLEEQRKKDEAREKEEEAKQVEEEKLRKEEEAKRELEEYLKLKESFAVEGEGFDETQMDKESQNLLQEFVDYIKNAKVVLMEDLASQFRLKTQEAIDRVHSLQSDGKLTGVIDDRGKFIYVSQQELEAVAKFIRQRGRVSISELVESSNTLINITPCNS